MDAICQSLHHYVSDPTQHNAQSLESILNDAIRRTLNDNAFRSQLGCSADFWKHTHQALGLHTTASTFTFHQVCVIALLKLSRNAVAHERVNQQLAIAYGILHDTEKLMVPNLQNYEEQAILLLRVGTQAVCNMLTGNDLDLEKIWKEWMRDADRGRLYCQLLNMNDETIMMSTLVLVLNCIKRSPERCRLMIKSKTGRTMLYAILDDMDRLHSQEHNKNFELGYAIVSELMDNGHFVDLYRSIESQDDAPGRLTMLIKLLDSKIHADSSQGIPGFMAHKELRKLAKLVTQFCHQGVAALEAAHQGDDADADTLSGTYTSLVLVLQMTSSLLTRECADPEFSAMLGEEKALPAVIDLLRHCETVQTTSFQYVKRDSVRLIGALCYHNRQMQDETREQGGIPLVLAQCKIDDANPYIREYAVLAIRNILEENDANQALIAELQPMQAVQTPELDEMGLETRLEDGKVKIVKKVGP
ncbi:spinocerebellar ataxia type 10 protein domain-domain-containing protein [Syncephalastrum racemosum]|uniref:Ataxin-10 homolog n=1 Tax=Syncephalastrum racemosum TaxID=13706 RepID=A0A1X2HAI2_SYNRA|nr:spinocerebellar ataxia type 10 protein domain-domain-containing protein [Syncephalastrum racemosum]